MWAFTGCTGLKEIYATNPVPPICGSVDSYLAYWLALGWGDFENIVEMDMTNIPIDDDDDDSLASPAHEKNQQPDNKLNVRSSLQSQIKVKRLCIGIGGIEQAIWYPGTQLCRRG